MGQTINTAFSVGDVVYIAIHPTADILQCIVNYVRVVPINATDVVITYKVTRTDINQTIDYILEADLYTFANAKAELLSWLALQTTKITNMTEPPAPTV